jgi:CO/xanthine dehydrogenase Mo-binding subunit
MRNGRGFSYVRYRGNENYVAMALAVAVDPATGKVGVPDQPLMGGGEASMTPVGGPLANAIFDATGVGLRTVPFTSERIKSAVAATRAG